MKLYTYIYYLVVIIYQCAVYYMVNLNIKYKYMNEWDLWIQNERSKIPGQGCEWWRGVHVDGPVPAAGGLGGDDG